MNKQILTMDNIVLDAHPKDKWDAIRMCGQILADNGYVRPGYIHDMYERERIATVYIGNQIAIPHGTEHSEKYIIDSGISVLQTPEGVSFGEEKAYLFFGIAGKDGTHIDILAKIATICSDMKNVEKIKNSRDKKEIVDILQNEYEENDDE